MAVIEKRPSPDATDAGRTSSVDIERSPGTDEAIDRRNALDVMLAEFVAIRDFRLNVISLAEGRLKLFLTTIAAGTTGIALILQWLDGDMRYVLSAFIYVGLLLFGLGTFLRMVERSLLATLHTRGLNRLRCFFVQEIPRIGKYYIFRLTDDYPSFRAARFTTYEGVLTDLPVTVAIINSLLAGAGVLTLSGVILEYDWFWSALCGILISSVYYYVQKLYEDKRIRKMELKHPATFPLGSIDTSTRNGDVSAVPKTDEE